MSAALSYLTAWASAMGMYYSVRVTCFPETTLNIHLNTHATLSLILPPTHGVCYVHVQPLLLEIVKTNWQVLFNDRINESAYGS